MRRSTLTVPCHQRSPASGPGLPRGRKITAGKERHSLIVILFGALRCSSQRSSLTQGHSRESARATLWNVLGWGYTTLTFTFRHSLSLASRWKHSSCPTCTWTLSSREPCRCIFILLTVFHLHFHRMTLSLLILVFSCKPGRLFATYKDPLDHLHWAGTLLLYMITLDGVGHLCLVEMQVWDWMPPLGSLEVYIPKRNVSQGDGSPQRHHQPDTPSRWSWMSSHVKGTKQAQYFGSGRCFCSGGGSSRFQSRPSVIASRAVSTERARERRWASR